MATSAVGREQGMRADECDSSGATESTEAVLGPLRMRRAETTDRESGEAISRSVACSGDGTERASAIEQCVGASAPCTPPRDHH